MNHLRDHITAPLKIAGIYALIAGLWILFSDKLLASLVTDPRRFTQLSIAKGWFFVIVTAVMLNLLIRHYMAAFRESAVKYGIVADNTYDWEFWVSPQGDFLYMSPSCKRVTGHDVAEFMADPGLLMRITHPDDRQRLVDHRPLECTSREPAEMEFRIVRPNGSIRWIHHICQSAFNDAGIFLGTRGSNRDITERKETEAALYKSEERFRNLVETTSDFVWEVDGQGVYTYVSPQVGHILGYTQGEMLGKTPFDFMPPDEAVRVGGIFRGIVACQRPFSCLENTNMAKTGELVVLETSGSPFFASNGSLAGYRGIDRDITGRKQADEALKTQFEEISTIFDSLNAVVFVSEMENDSLLYLNRYGASLFSGDWHGKGCAEVLRPAQQTGRSFCDDECLSPNGKPQSLSVWEFQNSVTGRWYQCNERAIRWPDGRMVRLEIAVDISEQKEMERMKDEMISAVSHEMRTPLTAMMGYSEFMLETPVDEKQRKSYLTTIYKETARLNELIGNFLDLQQIKARLTTYRFRPVAVEPLLRDAADLFTADHDRHRLSIDIPRGLPPIKGDEARLHQVLTNLISNAVKYSPPGSLVSLGARCDGENVTFWVRDEGQGVPLELQEKIFERFYRLDNTDRRLVGGTGLGLALVKEIVTAHKGQVWVESAPGTGSTFFVSLPVAAPNGTALNNETCDYPPSSR